MSLSLRRIGNPAAWVVLCAAVLAMATGCAIGREFRVADNRPADYPTVQALQFMADKVEERTGGRHWIRIFRSSQLGEEEQTIQQTRAGVIDLVRTNVAPLGSLVPAANVLSLPFLFRSVEHLHHVLDQSVGKEILASFEPHGFVGLTFYDSGARSIYNNVRPVRSLEDVKGLRIRVQQSDLMSSVIRSMGAEPIALPFGQVAAALSAKLVDGAENNWPSYVASNHYKLAPYYSLTEHAMSPEVLVMSPLAWERLSSEDRDIFRDAAEKSSVYMRKIWAASEERSRQQARAAGNIIIDEIDRKPFEDAMNGIYAKAITDEDARQLIDRIRQVH